MIDLTVWNITLPVQTPAQVVATKAMPALKNKYFDNNGQRIVFWAPVTGSHTGKANTRAPSCGKPVKTASCTTGATTAAPTPSRAPWR